MGKTLVLFAHPYLEYSTFNAQVIEVYRHHPEVSFRDLYEEYPDFHIAAFRERKRIKDYEKIIFHFPMIWLGMPPLLSLWLNEVLDMKWLNKINESPLLGKKALIVVSTGGSEAAFSSEGLYQQSVEDYLMSLKMSLELTGVEIERILPIYTAKQQNQDYIEQIKTEISEFLN